jgi:hypothetical protein
MNCLAKIKRHPSKEDNESNLSWAFNFNAEVKLTLFGNLAAVLFSFKSWRCTAYPHFNYASAVVKFRLFPCAQVAYLVEAPSPLLGRFDPAFLTLPREVLVTVMRKHQRYFPIEDAATGQLKPAFVTVKQEASSLLFTAAAAMGIAHCVTFSLGLRSICHTLRRYTEASFGAWSSGNCGRGLYLALDILFGLRCHFSLRSSGSSPFVADAFVSLLARLVLLTVCGRAQVANGPVDLDVVRHGNEAVLRSAAAHCSMLFRALLCKQKAKRACPSGHVNAASHHRFSLNSFDWVLLARPHLVVGGTGPGTRMPVSSTPATARSRWPPSGPSSTASPSRYGTADSAETMPLPFLCLLHSVCSLDLTPPCRCSSKSITSSLD